MPQQVKVQVLFWEETVKGRYQDAIYYTPEEYEQITQAEIDVEKQKRLDKWLAIVTVPPVEPTKADYERNIAEAQSTIALMQSDILEYQTKITELENQ